jgi:general secretion pathway protein I
VNQRGFTLLEVMTAVVILATALGLVITLFGSGLRSARLTQEYSHALIFAQEKIDEDFIMSTVDNEDNTGEAERGFTWEKVTSPFLLSDEEVPGISQAEVRVMWAEGEREKSITFYGLVLESEDDGGV